MSGSTYGSIFKITTWGESHGKALGVVIDGCPAGLALSEEDIQKDLDRRKPGTSEFTTKRRETDAVEILSGVFEGKTTGTAISMIVYNKDQRSSDYDQTYRPGHADLSYDLKYGFRDYRGGGRSSGRETVARVAAGAVARKVLQSIGVSICAYTCSVGSITIAEYNMEERLNNPLCMPDAHAYEKATSYIFDAVNEGDSVGGVIECVVKGIPAGVGEPVFDKIDAQLSKAIMSIGAVKAIEFGNGFKSAELKASDNNDTLFYKDGIKKSTNNAGGISGGITDGSDIIFRAAVKPTPSISKAQATVDKSNNNVELKIKGRHDPIIVPRAVIVVEAMTAVTLIDMLFVSMTSKMDNVKKFFLH